MNNNEIKLLNSIMLNLENLKMKNENLCKLVNEINKELKDLKMNKDSEEYFELKKLIDEYNN